MAMNKNIYKLYVKLEFATLLHRSKLRDVQFFRDWLVDPDTMEGLDD